MSVKYIPVQWNNVKWKYNFILLLAMFGYLGCFIFFGRELQTLQGTINPQILFARAFGSLAFFMLSFILAIGPLARLDTRFLPLLYNRRHFGVLTLLIAITHAGYVINWYFIGGEINKFKAIFLANTDYTQIIGFPFEIFGAFALLCLAILAFTSHDFWLKFLTPPLWKKLHLLIYPAYIAIIAHIALGTLQDQKHLFFTLTFIFAAAIVATLHIITFVKEEKIKQNSKHKTGYVKVCNVKDMKEGFANIAKINNNERVAVFLHEGKISAISNACAHQNGPLGEGKIIRCLVTCPWHGFQYNVTNGKSPKPFTEKIPTYNVYLIGRNIYVDPKPNKPGTYVKPLEINNKIEKKKP